MMLPIHVTLNHYKREDIQEEMIVHANNKEIAAKFGDKFGKRPDVLRNNSDVLEFAKQGATSFHSSEELWRNPLQIDASMKRHELDNLRLGWDLVIDIDCHVFAYSKIAADLVIKALKFHKVKSVSCKFSGNRGFHIGVPFDAFPEKVKNDEIKNMFPEAPRKIAMYLKHMILPEFGDRILNFEGDIGKVLEKTGKTQSEVIFEEKGQKNFNAESILQMDTLLISSRHLYRIPYSLHEKSGMVSIPINPDKVLDFKKEMALPSKAQARKDLRFLDRENVEFENAKRLFVEAFDFGAKMETIGVKGENTKELDIPRNALPEELFPPCIKLILNGMDDGKKRALFILVNYLTSVGWNHDDVEKKLTEWNKKNREPLRDVYLLGQIRYHKQVQKKILPPNCSNEMYMLGIGVCKPDSFCAKIKNPAQYTTKKAWMMNNQKPKKAKKKAKGKVETKEEKVSDYRKLFK